METIVGILIAIGVIASYFMRDESPSYSLPPGEEVTEEDMSPVVELLMFDDFMEDGDLDIF